MFKPTLRRGPRRLPEPPIQALVAIIAVSTAAVLATLLNRYGTATPDQYVIFTRLFLFNDNVESIAVVLALVAAMQVERLQLATIGLARQVGAHPFTACAAAFVVCAAGSRFVYLGHPLSMDEYAPVLQAHAFARGELAVHYPVALFDRLVAPEFRGWFLLVDRSTGAVMSAYWPGLALLLTPFVFLHAAWALNAALTALALALIGDFAARAGRDPAGADLRRGWAMLAALASPVFLVDGMSFYAIPGLLALNLLYLWLLLRPGHGQAFAAGVVGSLALVLNNPLPHALMALPCLAWMAADRTRRARLAWLVAGYLPLAGLLGLGWPMIESQLHLGSGRPLAQTHESLVTRLVNVPARMFHLPQDYNLEARRYATWKIWIWACPGLVFSPFVVRPRDAASKLLLAAFVLTYLFYFVVPFDQGHGWGYRYIHPAWGVLPIAGGVWFARGGAARTLGAIVVAAGLLATPVYLWETRETVTNLVSHLIEPPPDGRWVVFVSQNWRYTKDLVQNLPGDDRVLRLVGDDERSDAQWMAEHFPGAVRIVDDERGSSWRLPDGPRPVVAD